MAIVSQFPPVEEMAAEAAAFAADDVSWLQALPLSVLVSGLLSPWPCVDMLSRLSSSINLHLSSDGLGSGELRVRGLGRRRGASHGGRLMALAKVLMPLEGRGLMHRILGICGCAAPGM